MGETPKICGNCLYYLPDPNQEPDNNFSGLCMRYPPIVPAQDRIARPSTFHTNWCGEWKDDKDD